MGIKQAARDLIDDLPEANGCTRTDSLIRAICGFGCAIIDGDLAGDEPTTVCSESNALLSEVAVRYLYDKSVSEVTPEGGCIDVSDLIRALTVKLNEELALSRKGEV